MVDEEELPLTAEQEQSGVPKEVLPEVSSCQGKPSSAEPEAKEGAGTERDISLQDYLSLSGRVLAYVFSTAEEAEKAAKALGTSWAESAKEHRRARANGLIVAIGQVVSHESAERWRRMRAVSSPQAPGVTLPLKTGVARYGALVGRKASQKRTRKSRSLADQGPARTKAIDDLFTGICPL